MSKRIPKISGVYKITCVENGRIYIGSSNDIRHRWKQHKYELKTKRHGNRHLQRAYDKYGEYAFTFEVIELVMPWSLLDRENYWLTELKPFQDNGFNIGTTAEAPTRGTKRSSESIIKMRNAKIGKPLSQEHKTKLSTANKGKPRSAEAQAKTVATRKENDSYHHTEETRIKIGNIGRGRKHTPEARLKISAIQSKSYIITSPNGEILKVLGLTHFCRQHELSNGAMCDVAKGRRPHYKGWKCRYEPTEAQSTNR